MVFFFTKKRFTRTTSILISLFLFILLINSSFIVTHAVSRNNKSTWFKRSSYTSPTLLSQSIYKQHQLRVASPSNNTVLPIGSNVLFQAFYWEPNNVMVPDNGAWWSILKQRVPELAQDGFDSVWLPPPQKTPFDNIATMGYEPYDYYDLGTYNQKERVRTRYGTQSELQSLIQSLNAYGIAAIADIVINHNNGGKDEFNPYAGKITPTDFMDIASGVFPRNYTCFWPDEHGNYDQLQFGTFPDLRHTNPYVHDSLIEWGKWLRDVIGYDGWRFDVAAGIIPQMLRDWMLEVGNWGVAEYWVIHEESLPLYTMEKQIQYLEDTNNTVNAFDFELRLVLRDMMNSDGSFDMRKLPTAGLLWNGYAKQAVTLVSNHDTARDSRISITKDKYLGYAYILTHEGYPSVYWKDYYDPFLGPHIKTLLKLRPYAQGNTSILYVDQDLYIAQRNGNPGLIIALNDNPHEWKEARVTTKWMNTKLFEMTGQGTDVLTDINGNATIRVPPRGYLVYTQDEPTYLKTPLPPPALNYDTFTPNTTLTYQKVTLDGKFTEEWWGKPSLIDNYGDASRTKRDLQYLFMRYDDENLYLGIYHGTRLEPEPGMQLGIAISTGTQGADYAPYGHDEIRFMGSGAFPNYMYFLDTNDTDPWNDFSRITRFTYTNNKWDQGTILDNSRFRTDPAIGFLELKIPLTELNLENGGSFRIKLITTSRDKPAGYDSLANDNTIRGDGYETSWVKLDTTFIIPLQNPKTTSQLTQSSEQQALPFPFLSVLLVSFTFFFKKHRTPPKNT